ncbi:MAG TPA: zf-HC2 domain-containing protein [Puia sp.]|jgi:hypothetical protein|nr:zf-HC2 domain-containing protein [Puia sp.]
MHCKEIQAVLIEYLDQSLDAGFAAVVKKHIDSCAACQQEVLEVQELLVAMKDSPSQKPTNALRDNFNTLLQSELNMISMTHLLEEDPTGGSDETGSRRKDDRGMARGAGANRGSAALLPFSGPIWKVAAAIVLLVGGAWIGSVLQEKKDAKPDQLASLQKEVKEMKQVLLFSLIDDESASQRIKAVSYTEEMSNPNQDVIDALMNTLNNDKNANVRLASLYSLARWADNRTVRDSLVLSLGKQTEPIVQIVLINLLAEKRETRAIAPIKAILSNGKALKEVKDAAQKGLRVL